MFVDTTRLETIGSAAAGIAHDMNNHLTLLLNHLALPDIESARDAATRCCALTTSLLAYSRGETLAFESLDSAAFIQEFARQLNLPPEIHLTIEKKLRPAVGLLPRLPARLPKIRANRNALYRALTNLVSNACAAMPAGGVLRISLCPAAIVIEDSGTGILPANLKNIFEPFFTTKGSAGTGLGLAIVRDIMRQHGGYVTVDSEPGRGSRFELRFRLQR